MTIVRTNSSAATQLLLAYLSAITDIAAEPLGAQEVRVSLLGSYREDAMRLALYLRLRAWEAGQRAEGHRREARPGRRAAGRGPS